MVCTAGCYHNMSARRALKIPMDCTGGPNKEEYAVTLEFHGEIDVAASKRLVNAHQLFFTIQKKEGGDYWPRLLKDKTRQHWLKIDFNKWKDQDDDDEDEKKYVPNCKQTNRLQVLTLISRSWNHFLVYA